MRWRVDGILSNQSTVAAHDNTTIAVGSLSSTGTLAAGLGQDGKLGDSGNLSIKTDHALAANGRNLAAGSMSLLGTSVNLAGSQTFAGGKAIVTATAGSISLRGGSLTAADSARLTATGALLNGGKTQADGGTLTAGTLLLNVASLDNRYGALQQRGQTDLAIQLDGDFNNAHGRSEERR